MFARYDEVLAGLAYPATKDALLAHARQSKADEELMLALYGLPERSFESPPDVAAEIDRQQRRFRR